MTDHTDTSSSASATSTTHEGGCLCGVVRFTVEGPPTHADWCHCRECQRSSGSTAIPWGIWPAESFRVTEGRAHVACFASSYRGHRHFCNVCGATLHMTDPTEEEAGAKATVGIPLTALDDPEAVRPASHGWTAEQVSWARAADDLPVYEKDVPE